MERLFGAAANGKPLPDKPDRKIHMDSAVGFLVDADAARADGPVDSVHVSDLLMDC